MVTSQQSCPAMIAASQLHCRINLRLKMIVPPINTLPLSTIRLWGIKSTSSYTGVRSCCNDEPGKVREGESVSL